MTKIDENIQTAQNMLSWMVERCYELEEENKNLNKEIENHKQNIMQDELEIIPKLEEENKKLKSDLYYLPQGNGKDNYCNYFNLYCSILAIMWVLYVLES